MDAFDSSTERRVSYDLGQLDERTVAADPSVQFGTWYEELLALPDVIEPAAVVLATSDATRRPSARVVLLRGRDERGYVFFTNYDSRKGRELDANPQAALLFFWERLQRQVRIEGRVERVTAAESDAYFERRPRGHRLSAWASRQSAVVANREQLEAQFAQEDARFASGDVPRPPFWGGYRVVPDAFEFWQGRRNRVHDRIAYLRAADGWRIERLSP
jgi:pyridoxamine 5'-phosphate oxidase